MWAVLRVAQLGCLLGNHLLVSDLFALGHLLKLAQLASDTEYSRGLLSSGNLGETQRHDVLRRDLVARKLSDLVGKILVDLASLRHGSLARLRDLSEHLAQYILDLVIVNVVDGELESLSAGDVVLLLGHCDLLSEAPRLRFWVEPFVPLTVYILHPTPSPVNDNLPFTFPAQNWKLVRVNFCGRHKELPLTNFSRSHKITLIELVFDCRINKKSAPKGAHSHSSQSLRVRPVAFMKTSTSFSRHDSLYSSATPMSVLRIVRACSRVKVAVMASVIVFLLSLGFRYT